MVSMRVIVQNFIQLLEVKLLNDSISTEFLPPLNHISPHAFCFLNVKFPCFQKPAHHVIIIMLLWQQFIQN
nr:hypothetical protein Iba_chr14aCG14320 [Ipomoea batatas]